MDDQRVSRRRVLAGAGLVLSIGTAGCSLSAPIGGEESETEEDDSGFPDEYEDPEIVEEPPAQNELTEVYRDLVDSVVAVRHEDERGAGGGSGWVYQDNYVVTNEHVARISDTPFLWFKNHGWREASIVGMDRHSDLAVLEVDSKPEDATSLSMVDIPQAVGTPVAAIGNPFRLTSSFTTGVISGRNRTIQLPNRAFSIADGIQTDAAVNPGNSGGPLVTYDGEVAGVISASRQGENIGFAISAAMTKRVVPELIDDGNYEHTYLGVWLRDVTPAIIESNDLGGVTWGVYIDEVIDDTPADGSLQGSTSSTTIRGREVPVGGDVIVRMDDQPIVNRERLSAFLALETEPGTTITIEIIRDGERQTVDVTLEQRPDPDSDAAPGG